MVSRFISGLMKEHEEILRLMAELAGAIEGGSRDALSILERLEREADIHYRKEEEILFPGIKAYFEEGMARVGGGVKPVGGPVSVLLAEHKVIRGIIGEVRDAITTGDLSRARLRGGHLIELVRSHIFREDSVLFRLAESILSDEELEGMEIRARSIDADPDARSL